MPNECAKIAGVLTLLLVVFEVFQMNPLYFVF